MFLAIGEPCSTSVLDGMQPLRCPSNHECKISTEEDTQLNIPNRGECIRIHDKGMKVKVILEIPSINQIC